MHPRSGAVGLPTERGPLSAHVLGRLRGRRTRIPVPQGDGLTDDDLQLALYLCYELHYGGLPGVSDDLEWDPVLLALRARLERQFLRSLFDRVGPPRTVHEPIALHVRHLVDMDDGPSLSRYMEADGTMAQMREFVVHRSAYQLKEGDPHTWAIPRLDGATKRALVDIQVGEYGAEDEAFEMHSTLFADTMGALGLDPRRHAHLDSLPAAPLANSNLVSMFGLHRRWRGALVGHLTVFEMTSAVPMARYSTALARLGADPRARRFYDVHIAADTVHEVIALDRMASSLQASEPALMADVAFGARAVIELETMFAQHLLHSWQVATSSLRQPTAA